MHQKRRFKLGHFFKAALFLMDWSNESSSIESMLDLWHVTLQAGAAVKRSRREAPLLPDLLLGDATSSLASFDVDSNIFTILSNDNFLAASDAVNYFYRKPSIILIAKTNRRKMTKEIAD